MIMLVSVTCSNGHLVKIHNDRDNLGWKEENKQNTSFWDNFQYEPPMIHFFFANKYMSIMS